MTFGEKLQELRKARGWSQEVIFSMVARKHMKKNSQVAQFANSSSSIC